jgi:hypothetical protein
MIRFWVGRLAYMFFKDAAQKMVISTLSLLLLIVDQTQTAGSPTQWM